MRGCVRILSLSLVVGLSAGLLGCSDPNKNVVKDDQSAQRLEDRIRQLEADLDAARNQRNADQAEIDRLKKELEAARAKKTEAAPAGWTGVPGGAMTSIEGTVLFDSGKADLKPTARKVLEAVTAAIQKNYPDREIFVFGHTDSDPIKFSKWKDNYELSCQRALSVVRFLQKDGVANYMAACGWGEHRPAVEAANKEAKQANRRVVIYAMIPQAMH